MLLIPISPLIAACAAHFGTLKIILIAVFSAFCQLSISSPFMSITSAPYRALGSTTPLQYISPIIIRWQLFSMTEFVIMLIFFRIWFFCPSNTFLFACTITPSYFSSSTTSILLIFLHSLFVLNRIHWYFCSFSWSPYYLFLLPLCLLLILIHHLHRRGMWFLVLVFSFFLVFLISSIILYVISLNSIVDAVHPCLIPLVTSISIYLFSSSRIFVLSSLYILTVKSIIILSIFCSFIISTFVSLLIESCFLYLLLLPPSVLFSCMSLLHILSGLIGYLRYFLFW